MQKLVIAMALLKKKQKTNSAGKLQLNLGRNRHYYNFDSIVKTGKVSPWQKQ